MDVEDTWTQLVNETTNQPIAVDTQLASNSHYTIPSYTSSSRYYIHSFSVSVSKEGEFAVENEDETGILKKEKLKLEIEYLKKTKSKYGITKH